jgi:hypothetical protein
MPPVDIIIGYFVPGLQFMHWALNAVINISIAGRHAVMLGTCLMSSLHGKRPDMTCKECRLSPISHSPLPYPTHAHTQY